MVCLVFMLICATNYIVGCAEEVTTSDTKVLIDHNSNYITGRPNRVKPTSQIVHHKPGVPPGWDKVPSRPVVIGGLFSFRNLRVNEVNPKESLRESNIVEVFTEFVTSSSEPTSSNVVTEVIVTTDVKNITETTLNQTNLVDANVSWPALGETEPVVLGNGDPDKTGVLNWVLTSLGINRPATPQESTYRPPTRECKSCICGETFKQTRIVGGVETEVNAYPWVVYLIYKGTFYCGASLVSDTYALTAGHCVSFPKERIAVVMLDHDRASTSETKTITRKVTAIFKHKYYNNGGSYNNDIALLRLESPVDFEGLLRPVCLPPIGKNFNGDLGVVVGWGATKEGGSVSNTLMEVAVPIMTNEECRQTNYGSKITENMMCAGDVQHGSIDSCQGDSGGPLHVVKNGKHLVAGIVSWGEGCAQKNYPGVYTRVNRYISWIKANTKESCYCDATKK